MESNKSNSPEMIPNLTNDAQEFKALSQRIEDLKRQEAARIIDAVAAWATRTTAEVSVLKALLVQRLGVTEQEIQQAVAATRGSIQGRQPLDSLAQLAELLQKL
jgi:hypothetical protein